MWFKKKRKNKRHRRRNVLDVKLRSDHMRAVRARGLAVMVGVLFGTVFTLYVLWRSGEWVLDRLVYENRAFTIQVAHGYEVHCRVPTICLRVPFTKETSADQSESFFHVCSPYPGV